MNNLKDNSKIRKTKIIRPYQSMNEYHLLTQLKQDVENKRIKKYQQIKQNTNNKYFELYLNKIIFIQRFWRRRLVSKGLIL